MWAPCRDITGNYSELNAQAEADQTCPCTTLDVSNICII